MFIIASTGLLLACASLVSSVPQDGGNYGHKDWNKLNIVQAGSVPGITYVGAPSNPSKLSLYWRGTDNLYRNVHIDLLPDGKEKWGETRTLEGRTFWSNPTATRFKDRQMVFGLGMDNKLQVRDKCDTGNFENWYGLHMGPVFGTPASCTTGETAQVFVRAVHSNSYWYHNRAQNNHWSGHIDLGGTLISNPSAAGFQPSKGNFRSVVIGVGTDNNLWQRFFQGQNWLEWKNQGGTLIGNPVAVPSTPRPECNHDFSAIDIYATHASGILHRMLFDGDTWQEWDRMPFNVPKEFSCINLKNGTHFYMVNREWSLVSRTFVMPK